MKPVKSGVEGQEARANGIPALVHHPPQLNKIKVLRILREKNGYKNGENNRQNLYQMHFKPSRLYPLKGKQDDDWYVHYEVYDPDTDEYKPKKIRVALNRQKTVREKKLYGAALMKIVDKYLKGGRDPDDITELDMGPSDVQDPGKDIRDMDIIKGLRWAKEQHDPLIAPTTRNEYRNMVDVVCTTIRSVGYATVTVGAFRKAHLRKVMDTIQQKRKLSNHRYNAFVNCLKGISKEFVKYDAFDISPLASFESKKELQPKGFARLTDKEKKTVYDHLKKVHPDFLTYFLLIYHTALRPKELVSLQIYNFDPEEGVIKIRPDETVIIGGLEHDKTKTEKTRYIAIPAEAMKLLLAMKLDQYPKEYFIFSTGFKPGPVNIKRKRATEVWAREVIKKLKIDKKMYGAKHLGMDDRVISDISIEAIQRQAGHASQGMTERYTEEHRKKLAAEIRKKSKGFLE